MAAQREAFDQVEGYLYVVNSDGTLPVFMSIRKEKLKDGIDMRQKVSLRT